MSIDVEISSETSNGWDDELYELSFLTRSVYFGSDKSGKSLHSGCGADFELKNDVICVVRTFLVTGGLDSFQAQDIMVLSLVP